jgi:peptidoglycan/LPS O-acetylase OafA/YrhL
LITGLLIEEEDRSGTVSLKRFYGKRIRRIWPLYFLTLLIGISWLHFAPALPKMFAGIPDGGASWWKFVFFLGNAALIASPGLTPILAVLWSVSVEEQFYLLWPLVVQSARKQLIWILIGIVIGSAINRVLFFNHPGILAYATFSVMGYLALGALAAIMFAKESLRDIVSKYKTLLAISSLVAILALIVIRISLTIHHSFATRFTASAFPLLFGIAFSILILALATFSRISTPVSKATVYLGKISYGLYCYHMLALLCMMAVFGRGHRALLTLCAFAATIVIASVSYQFFERPIMRRKTAQTVSF